MEATQEALLLIASKCKAPSSQWIRTKQISSPTSFHSTPPSASIPLQLSLGLPSTALFSFLTMYRRRRPSSSFVSRPYAISLLPHRAPPRSASLVYIKVFIWPLLTYASPEWFPFPSVTEFTNRGRLQRTANRAITGCLSYHPDLSP